MPFSPEELETRRGESRVGTGITVTIVMTAIALVFVALRLYVRRFLVKVVHSDDYAILGAMIVSIAMSTCMGISYANGMGRHVETVSPDELTRQMRMITPVSTAYITIHMLIKLSILLQYVRLSVMRFERALCYSLIAVSTSGWLALLIITFVICVPLHAVWTPNTPGAKCLNTTAAFFAGLIFNMVMDFAILVVPAFILRHLTVAWTQRLLLGVVLAFGGLQVYAFHFHSESSFLPRAATLLANIVTVALFFVLSRACIISALRLQTIYATTTSQDKAWDSAPSAMYATAELNLGIACASVVAYRPVIRQLRRLFSGGGPDQQARVDPRSMNPRPRIIPDEIPSFGNTQVPSGSGGVELSTVNEELGRTRSTTSSRGRILKGTGPGSGDRGHVSSDALG